MTDVESINSEVVRVTTWSVAYGNPDSTSKRATPRPFHWTVNGIDAAGHEVTYAEFDNEEDFNSFRESDPLWKYGIRQMFNRLLSNPSTRDTVIKINMQAALDRGDFERCEELARALSPRAFEEIFGDFLRDRESTGSIE